MRWTAVVGGVVGVAILAALLVLVPGPIARTEAQVASYAVYATDAGTVTVPTNLETRVSSAITRARATRLLVAGVASNGATLFGATSAAWGYSSIIATNDYSAIGYHPIRLATTTTGLLVRVHWAARTNDVGNAIAFYSATATVTAGGTAAISYPASATNTVVTGTAVGSWIRQEPVVYTITPPAGTMRWQYELGSRSTDTQVGSVLILGVEVEELP